MMWFNPSLTFTCLSIGLVWLVLFLVRLYRHRTFFKGLVRSMTRTYPRSPLTIEAKTSAQFHLGSSEDRGRSSCAFAAEYASSSIPYRHCPEIQLERHILRGSM